MKISGFEDAISINEFEYACAVNEHEKCSFTVSVREKDLDNVKKLIDNYCKIEDDFFSFEGKITDITTEFKTTEIDVTVIVKGSTIDLDKEKKWRVFQDPEKTLKDILTNIGIDSKIKVENYDEKIDQVIVQKNETDWEFINRIAFNKGLSIYPGKDIIIGNSYSPDKNIDIENVLAMKHTISTNTGCIECKLNDALEIGDNLTYEGVGYNVVKVTYLLDNEEYSYIYSMKEIKDVSVEHELPRYIINAKVVENNDPENKGRLQVEFLEPFEDVMKDNPIWISSESIYASDKYGIVIIPAVDDVVRVEISDGIPLVIASIRSVPYDDRYNDCNTKYLFIDDETHLELDKENFVFNNSKIKMVVDKDNIDITVDDKNEFKIYSDGYELKTDKSHLQITTGVKIEADGIEADGKKSIDASATNVNIKGKSGVNIN